MKSFCGGKGVDGLDEEDEGTTMGDDTKSGAAALEEGEK